MRRPLLLLVLATAVASLLLAPLRASDPLRTAARAAERTAAQPRLPYAPGEVIVQFRLGADDRQMERAIRAVGGVRARKGAFETP